MNMPGVFKTTVPHMSDLELRLNMPGVFKTTVPHMSDLELRNEHARRI